jgi:hypothetical protein
MHKIKTFTAGLKASTNDPAVVLQQINLHFKLHDTCFKILSKGQENCWTISLNFVSKMCYTHPLIQKFCQGLYPGPPLKGREGKGMGWKRERRGKRERKGKEGGDGSGVEKEKGGEGKEGEEGIM